MKYLLSMALAASAVLAGSPAAAETGVAIERNDDNQATAQFIFQHIPSPSTNDAATAAKFTLVDGEADDNGGGLEKLHDGKVPAEEDEPGENFFFNAGTEGGRIVVDLGRVIAVKQVNTYSWHPNTRGPQVYQLFASDGQADGFNAKPAKGTAPGSCGWKSVAKVDTRARFGSEGGQYAVSITNSDGALGKFRYLLFEVDRTETDDDFGNTFYSEIDVLDADPAAKPVGAGKAAAADKRTFAADGGKYQITIDASSAPDLAEWAMRDLAPVVQAWYPKLIALLPSEGFEAPQQVSITFRTMNAGTPAATSGSRVGCNSDWFRQNLKGEAKGAVIHELVHVIQHYERRGEGGSRPPGWMVEGIPDYLRWFKYEPESHGADLVWLQSRRRLTLSYDGSYRISANFLDWASRKYDADLVPKLNAAMRQGTYNGELWRKLTSHTVEELGAEWKKDVEAKLAAPAGAQAGGLINTLTDAEAAAGWKLLFNGRDFTGWHNFKHDGVRSGWEVKEGALVCADPHNAGDIVTADQYDWFELQFDYNISAGGNSGLMYHVTDAGGAVWATGPEFQLEDNQAAADPVRCGWLYALYQPPVDPKTGKPLDATKPAGEWNHVRLLITPEKCVHEINGVQYFEYVLGSEDFTNRIAKSKFASMPGFGRATSGYLALQGDHGRISFRNLKLRPIAAGK